ncbi:MAG: ATP-binding cassette domain-containing protein, partial [Lachnospiraceae bacterium]|nr:ATP-binding cassette domain-containing protein [Lachnospiraceae bacterium]
RDKIYLNTAGVFAWIIVVLVISALTERVVILGLKFLAKLPAPCPAGYEGSGDACTYNKNGAGFCDGDDLCDGIAVLAKGLVKTYDGRTVVDTDIRLKKGGIYYLKAPSGSGKSTLLGMLAGQVMPDAGSVRCGSISMVFQEDRLIEHANGIRNLRLAGCRGDLNGELEKLLPADVLMHPASDLSGGERRRLAVLRALLHPSDIVIMDEPFAGLDEETKKMTADRILRLLDGRTLVLATHGNEAEYFPGAEQIQL